MSTRYLSDQPAPERRHSRCLLLARLTGLPMVVFMDFTDAELDDSLSRQVQVLLTKSMEIGRFVMNELRHPILPELLVSPSPAPTPRVLHA